MILLLPILNGKRKWLGCEKFFYVRPDTAKQFRLAVGFQIFNAFPFTDGNISMRLVNVFQHFHFTTTRKVADSLFVAFEQFKELTFVFSFEVHSHDANNHRKVVDVELLVERNVHHAVISKTKQLRRVTFVDTDLK